jgi:DNA adenine methylase
MDFFGALLKRSLKGKFIPTYNDCRFVRGLYNGFKLRPAKVRYSVTRGVLGQKRGLFG